LLPYVKEGVEKITMAAKEKFGEAAAGYAADLAGKVWERVKSVFNSERDQATLTEFEEDPEAAASLLEKKLRTKIEQDPQLAQELDQLVNSQAPGGGGTGAQIIGATYAGIVDLRHGTVSGGVVSGLSINPPQPAPLPKSPPAAGR